MPLAAVLRGIDEAFSKWRTRKHKTRMVNSLAFCSQLVLTEAQRMAAGEPSRQSRESAPPFAEDELRGYLLRNAEAVRESCPEIAGTLEDLARHITDYVQDLEPLEQRLTALEDRMIATARSRQTEEQILAARRELEMQLRPWRSRMTAEQLAMLERQYLDRRLLDESHLPRLSLFYMR